SDVYALGATVYEMLTGDPPFTGSTAQAIVAKVMTERPRPIYPQRDTVPAAVEHAVLTALEKLPADRYATAAQFAEALHAPSESTAGSHGAVTSRHGGRVGGRAAWRARLRDPVVLALAALVIASAVFTVWARRPKLDAIGVVRFAIPVASSGRTNSLGYNVLSVSPDGRTLAYAGEGNGGHLQLMIRSLDNVIARPLPGTEDASQPTFSPDGRWLAFIRGNQLYRMAVDGGAPQLLATAPGTFAGASWSATGVIVVSGNTALYVIPESGGSARELGGRRRIPGEVFRDFPLVLDAERSVLYSSWSSSSLTSARIAIASLATGDATVLDLPGIEPLGVTDGTLVYATASGVIMGVPIDVAKRRLLGTPVQLVDNVVINNTSGTARAALARGTLFYQSGSQLSQVVVAGPGGPSRTILGEQRDYAFPRLSPDGRQLAITIGGTDRRDVWLDELSSGTLTRLT
ncbi:MAG: hypothetical protein ACRENC_11495, partial [Gemmatimonadaceae bacterium]